MTDIGPLQDIIEVGWKIVPKLVVVRMVYTHPDAIDLIVGPGLDPAAYVTGLVVSPFADGEIVAGNAADARKLNGITFAGVSTANTSAPGSYSFWIEMPAVLAAFAAADPTEDPENPGEFLDPVVPDEVAIDLHGFVSGQVDPFAIPVAVEVTVYGGRIATPVETFLPVAFNDFSVVNPGGRLTGRTDTILRQTMGNGYFGGDLGEFITPLVLGTQIASIRFTVDEVEDEE